MKLTKNFSKIEFESKDGSKMPFSVLENIQELAENLQVLRDYINKPIHINSAYRSPKHNKAIGGSKNSQHMKGRACDISVRDMSPKKVSRIILKLIKKGKMAQGGVGLYNGFVHYDIRGTKARWDNSPWYNFF